MTSSCLRIHAQVCVLTCVPRESNLKLVIGYFYSLTSSVCLSLMMPKWLPEARLVSVDVDDDDLLNISIHIQVSAMAQRRATRRTQRNVLKIR